MTKPLIGIFDCSTQEETTREMTDEEYQKYLEGQPEIQVTTNGN